MRRRWTLKEDLYIKNYYGLESLEETSAKLNRTIRSIKMRASKLKVPFNRATFNHNKDFFYFLGFIAADGNLFHKKGHGYKISSTISKKDGYLLDHFQKKYGGRAFEINDYYRIEIYSKPLYEELYKFGLTERKSKNLKVNWNKIPKEYFWSFIRGYFDGDGSAVKSKRLNGFNLIEFCSGTKEFLEEISKQINKRLNFKPKTIYYSKKARAHYLKYNKEESILISKVLQFDSVCLERKSIRLSENLINNQG